MGAGAGVDVVVGVGVIADGLGVEPATNVASVVGVGPGVGIVAGLAQLATNRMRIESERTQYAILEYFIAVNL